LIIGSGYFEKGSRNTFVSKQDFMEENGTGQSFSEYIPASNGAQFQNFPSQASSGTDQQEASSCSAQAQSILAVVLYYRHLW
jgi:hypothetical protein